MDLMALFAALGAFAIASPAFFFIGRRSGVAKGTSDELARLAAAKGTAEETARRIISEAEREVETSRKSAILSGKEEVMKLREAAEQDLRQRRTAVEAEERRLAVAESETIVRGELFELAGQVD